MTSKIDWGPEEPVLTKAQARYLQEITAAGEKTYNGRARRPLEALRAYGLIEFDYSLVPTTDGAWTERFVARVVA